MEWALPLAGEESEVIAPSGECATLSRDGRDWCLSWRDSSGHRTRWGNAEQIREDCEEFERTGTVLREPGGWS